MQEFFTFFTLKVSPVITIIGCSVWLWLWYDRTHLSFSFACKSGEGGKEENQDCCGARSEKEIFFSEQPEQKKIGKFCFVVADGLGGHHGGRTAAEITVRSILEYFNELKRIRHKNVRNELCNAIVHAHQSIKEEAQKDERLADMKATCVALILIGNKAYWSHIGDSRLYLLRDGKIHRKTIDHSVVQVLLEMGDITEEELASHPDRNRVLKTLGMDDEILPEVESESLRKGDCLLLCTDGFWEYYSAEELKKAWRMLERSWDYSPNPEEEAVTTLFMNADKKGQDSPKPHDNLTVQLIRVQ